MRRQFCFLLGDEEKSSTTLTCVAIARDFRRAEHREDDMCRDRETFVFDRETCDDH